MKILCTPNVAKVPPNSNAALYVSLYGRESGQNVTSVGAAIADEIRRLKIQPTEKAMDLLSIALSVIAADFSVQRRKSADGWTRELDLSIAVANPELWNQQRSNLEMMLRFLTTDVWSVSFVDGGYKLAIENDKRKSSIHFSLSCPQSSICT